MIIFLQVTSPTQLRSAFVLNNDAKLRMGAFSELIIHLNQTAFVFRRFSPVVSI